jgi:hypothetical protein
MRTLQTPTILPGKRLPPKRDWSPSAKLNAQILRAESRRAKTFAEGPLSWALGEQMAFSPRRRGKSEYFPGERYLAVPWTRAWSFLRSGVHCCSYEHFEDKVIVGRLPRDTAERVVPAMNAVVAMLLNDIAASLRIPAEKVPTGFTIRPLPQEDDFFEGRREPYDVFVVGDA